MVGTLEGTIHFYDSIENNLNSGESFSTVSDNFLNLSKNIGAYSSVFVNDIDSDGNLDMFIGQDLGGLFYLEHDVNSSVELEEHFINSNKLLLFPNPTSGELKIQSNFFPLEIQLYSSDWKELNRFFVTNQLSTIEIQNLPKGIYFLKEMKTERVYRIVKN
ncbi:MAG: T9SS type A sorting domain-containing protein [Bacteroidetes bacterium]|nr:T9SS type A sorting domain-containing protein [Bacteroidota bacterium]